MGGLSRTDQRKKINFYFFTPIESLKFLDAKNVNFCLI